MAATALFSISGFEPMHRFAPLLLIAALWLPLAASIWEPGATPLLENRKLASQPPLPRSWSEAVQFPQAADAWAKDNFGFRKPLLVAHNRLRFAVFGEYPSKHLLAGNDGMIFFNFGTSENKRLVPHLCGVNISAAKVSERAAALATFLVQMRAVHAESFILAVPDKSRVFPEALPEWVKAECTRATPPLAPIMDQVAQVSGLEGASRYPLAAVRAAHPPVYPPENFHWTLLGARFVADLIADEMLHRAPTVNLAYHPVPGLSDLSSFMPGLSRPIMESLPDFAAADILACQNQPDCFPEFAEAAGKLEQASRFRRHYHLPEAQRRPRLVILSDSFGANIAPGLAPYFAEVWHFSMNSLDRRLTPAERAQVRRIIFDLFQPDTVLHVYSEAAILWGDEYLETVRHFVTGD